MTKTIAELNVGDILNENVTLLLSSATMKPSKKEPFFQLNFQDKTGSIEGVMWKIPLHLNNLSELCIEKQGVVVSVIGKVTEYQGKVQLTADDLVILPEDQVDPTQFLPVVAQDRSEMWKTVKNLISQVRDAEYRNLLTVFFNDEKIRSGFVNGIGGLRHHHNSIGALMEHTIQVTSLALYAAEGPFMFPNLNKDLIITGGLLHDIGKIKEYLFSKAFLYNPYGIEHRYEGVAMIDVMIERHKLTIDPLKLKQLKNIIMSHHGEWGDQSIKAETPEATAIHHADCISAHVNGYFIKEAKMNG